MEEGRRDGRKEGKDAKEKEKKGGSEGRGMERRGEEKKGRKKERILIDVSTFVVC